MKLVFGHDAEIAQWAAARYRTFQPCFRALGVINRDGEVVGAATFHNFNGANVDIGYWGPLTIDLPVARGIARFVFWTLGAERMTAVTQRSNRRIKAGLPLLGFCFEGVLRRYYGPARKDDAIVFGLLHENAGRLLGKLHES